MLQLYSVFDKKTVSFHPPIMVKHVAEATRALQLELENPKSLLARHVGDYALYLVGSFDQSSGCVLPPSHGAPQFTIEAAALLPSIPTGKGPFDDHP